MMHDTSLLVLCDQEQERVRTRSMTKTLRTKLAGGDLTSQAMEEEPIPSVVALAIPHEVDMEKRAWDAGGVEWYPPSCQVKAWKDEEVIEFVMEGNQRTEGAGEGHMYDQRLAVSDRYGLGAAFVRVMAYRARKSPC